MQNLILIPFDKEYTASEVIIKLGHFFLYYYYTVFSKFKSEEFINNLMKNIVWTEERDINLIKGE